MKPASRLGELRPSPVRILSDGAPPGAIPLGLGEPSWELPEAGRRALAVTPAGPCGYGPNLGTPELRRAILNFYGQRCEDVVVTAGSQGALYALFQAWLDPGDAVLVPDPGFVSYPALARLAGARAVPYALAAHDRFRLDPEAFAACLAGEPRAKLAIVNHPSNPTGGGTSVAALAAVARAAAARDVLLISDEVYRDLYFGERPPSLVELGLPGVVTSSLSKGWAAPGLRVGWMVGSTAHVQPARTVHAFMVTSAARPSQAAALALVEDSDRVLASSRREVQARFAALSAAFKEHFGREITPPDGAFYHWLELPESAEVRADPMRFCLRLRDEAGVVLVPGGTFGEAGRTYVRLSFAAHPDQVAEGVRRLAPYW